MANCDVFFEYTGRTGLSVSNAPGAPGIYMLVSRLQLARSDINLKGDHILRYRLEVRLFRTEIFLSTRKLILNGNKNVEFAVSPNL